MSTKSIRTGLMVFAGALALVLSLPRAGQAQTAADSAAIRATALDYIEGFYTGDAERMERALHEDLKKRIVERKPGEPEVLDEMTAGELVSMTAGGGGTGMPDDLKRSDVSILDVYGQMASVKIVAGMWIDYMHLAEVDGEWKIVNVLWEMLPRE
ncbi:MAG: nuclear transport factor 2 family protein [marine benthic group bacterium]|nr:nuclear transport factor 2 family protein [Gemmatimonadota bacterium]